MYLIGKHTLVLDGDTFRLKLDYRSIVNILVKVLSNQDSATRMVLEPVRVQILSLAAWDGGVSLVAGLNLRCGHTSTRHR